MINQYIQGHSDIVLTSDLAGEFPLYVYWPKNQSVLLYSKSILELLNDVRVLKPLEVSSEGLSFLLQSGVVPPPKTIYDDIYILGIGDKAKISIINNKIDVQFSHEFPFLNLNRLRDDEMKPDDDFILKIIADSVIDRIDNSKPTFLFHSAGKDSNSIALALAEAGWQDRVTLITHKSKGKADESVISKKISQKLGFKHKVLNEIDQLKTEHKQTINDYFYNVPLPSVDNVTLAYPLYAYQLPDLKGSNIIDGGGNDSYMVTPPTERELKVLPMSQYTHYAYFIRNYVKTESLFSPFVRTPAEWCGMSGLSFFDTKKIFPDAINVYLHWKVQSDYRKNMDFFDFKTSMLTPIIASELHIRKARNFSDSISSNMILPFANQNVAEYFFKMPESYLFDRKKLKNKLILRKILKERMALDSDTLGKLGFSYDSRTVVLQNWNWMFHEMNLCPLWYKPGLDKVVNRMKRRMNGTGWGAIVAGRMLYRIYLISAWYNRNHYLMKF